MGTNVPDADHKLGSTTSFGCVVYYTLMAARAEDIKGTLSVHCGTIAIAETHGQRQIWSIHSSTELLLQRLSAPVPAMTVLNSLARPNYTSLRGGRIPRRKALPRERVCRNGICNSLCMRLECIHC
jgi:hypothetical protein